MKLFTHNILESPVHEIEVAVPLPALSCEQYKRIVRGPGGLWYSLAYQYKRVKYPLGLEVIEADICLADYNPGQVRRPSRDEQLGPGPRSNSNECYKLSNEENGGWLGALASLGAIRRV
eukprot:2055871-Rhodomonas_salina.1